jgi:hypothetical protein
LANDPSPNDQCFIGGRNTMIWVCSFAAIAAITAITALRRKARGVQELAAKRRSIKRGGHRREGMNSTN